MSDLGLLDRAVRSFSGELGLEQERSQPTWQQQVFRALFGGQRNFNALSAIGRSAGGNAKDVDRSVRNFLKVPFPRGAQFGGVDCEENIRQLAPEQLEANRRFTGRFESKKPSGHRYFWAINQAGTAIVAIRSPRGPSWNGLRVRRPKVMLLRGDVQSDGSAVLFNAAAPEAFWGYLKLEDDSRAFRFHSGSYQGPNGQRVFVDGDSDQDEILSVSADTRPTMMGPLIKTPDPATTELLKQSEWLPLTATQFNILERGARSDSLRDLIHSYLQLPRRTSPRTLADRTAIQRAAGRIQNYVEHLFWNGDKGREPTILSATGADNEHRRLMQALHDFSAGARKALPNGHYNNPELAAEVAKSFLAEEKLNHADSKLSFLDWLTKVAQEQKLTTLAGILDVPLVPPTGSYRYRVRFLLGYAAVGVALGLGTLIVEKLNEPKWRTGRVLYDVFVKGLGTPQADADEVFDLEVESTTEWMPGDFEGHLVLGGVSASLGIGKAGAEVGTFRGKNGLAFDFDEFGVSVRGQSKKQLKKPKLKLGGRLLKGTVERQGDRIFDLSKPFPATLAIAGDLPSAVHFCFGSSLLTAAGRQYLRVVCAEQLALLSDPSTKIVIAGHTDRPDTFSNNMDLARLRAKNVKRALQDILGDLRRDWNAIPTHAFGELMALLKLKGERDRNPQDRRVDVFVNGRLVATLAENPVTRNIP